MLCSDGSTSGGGKWDLDADAGSGRRTEDVHSLRVKINESSTSISLVLIHDVPRQVGVT